MNPFLLLLLCAAAAHRNEILAQGTKHSTDKVTAHTYHHLYNHFLPRIRLHNVKLLEIGLGCNMNSGSASINLWQAYFPRLDLWMADIDTTCAAKVQNTTKNTILIGDQGKEADLLRFIEESGGEFDVIVDDGSHIPAHQMESFRVLFSRALKPGGLYFMEDIESPDRTLCDVPFVPDTGIRDRVIYWTDQLLRWPRDLHADVPEGLMAIAVQSEMAVFMKCPLKERCPR